MNKIFKTKYDVTTGQTKAVSELASNRQVASCSGEKPKCGDFLGYSLGLFKVLPLALVISGMFSGVSYGAWVGINNKGYHDTSYFTSKSQIQYDGLSAKNEATVLSWMNNKTGEFANRTNKDFDEIVVIGSRAVAGGRGGTAIGFASIIGKNEYINDVNVMHQGTAVGYRAFARGEEATSIGNDTVAWGKSAIAIGSDNIPASNKALPKEVWELFRKERKHFNYTSEYTHTHENYDTYPEYITQVNRDKPKNSKSHNWAFGDGSIAIGAKSIAYGNYSTALGTFAIAKDAYSTALGANTIAFGERSLAIGNEAYVYTKNSVGIGNNVQALNIGSMVLGKDAYAGGLGAVAFGEKTFANVQMSPEFHDLALLYESGDTHTIQTYKKDKFKAATYQEEGTGEWKAKQSEDNSGGSNQGAIAIGSYSTALGDNTISLGRFAYAKEDNAIAIGRFAFAKEKDSFALGIFTRALSPSSMAIGNGATAELENSVALGYKSRTDYNHLNDAPYTPEGAIVIPTSNQVGVISIGYNGFERRMVNVAAGSQDTDAVNVAQLKALENRIDLNNKQNNLTPYFGVEQEL